jgi:hypothetical protein
MPKHRSRHVPLEEALSPGHPFRQGGTITFGVRRQPRISETLRDKLGREPTSAELGAEIHRLLEEAFWQRGQGEEAFWASRGQTFHRPGKPRPKPPRGRKPSKATGPSDA